MESVDLIEIQVKFQKDVASVRLARTSTLAELKVHLYERVCHPCINTCYKFISKWQEAFRRSSAKLGLMNCSRRRALAAFYVK